MQIIIAHYNVTKINNRDLQYANTTEFFWVKDAVEEVSDIVDLKVPNNN